MLAGLGFVACLALALATLAIGLLASIFMGGIPMLFAIPIAILLGMAAKRIASYQSRIDNRASFFRFVGIWTAIAFSIYPLAAAYNELVASNGPFVENAYGNLRVGCVPLAFALALLVLDILSRRRRQEL